MVSIIHENKNELFYVAFLPDAENMVFENKENALKICKTYKDARFKSFKSRSEALKFAKNGTNPVASIPESTLLCK